jgi:hypothetical protein
MQDLTHNIVVGNSIINAVKTAAANGTTVLTLKALKKLLL